MRKGTFACAAFLLFAVLYVALGAAVAWVIEVAWNAIVPLFHGPHIDYWAACLLYVALSIIGGLFKSVATSSGKS